LITRESDPESSLPAQLVLQPEVGQSATVCGGKGYLLLYSSHLNRRVFRDSPVFSRVGEWLSLVEHLVRDQGVGGSNPLSPTI
jgi:hypothetical protein